MGTYLATAINFISSKKVEEKRVIHSWSSNIKFTSYIGTDEASDELFESLQLRYIKRKRFFYAVWLMYYQFHKVNFKRGGSGIASADWIKKKKATINPKKDGW